MPDSAVVARLVALPAFGAVPRGQLEWLARHGTLRRLGGGDALLSGGDDVSALWVVLSGHLVIRIHRDSGLHTVVEWRAGDVTGKLPFSRLKGAPADVIALVPSDVLELPETLFRQMACDGYDLTAVFVHSMLDRARVFTSSDLLDDKMASLGRVAAGLAHELNNPASAVARTAKTLVQEVDRFEDACRAFGAAALSADEKVLASRLVDLVRVTSPSRSALDAADREDLMERWFDEHGVDEGDAHEVAASAVTFDDLDRIAALVGEPAALSAVLRYAAADATVRRLASDIDVAASRVHALVAAVKGFSYLDQQASPGRVDLGRGLSDSVTVLNSKARARGTVLQLDLPAPLPPLEGFGGALNQVWANLIDNAIDAAGPGGRVSVSARALPDRVVVLVRDTGSGISAEVQRRMFDPFFTTKPVGAGTGLGLDTARRIVAQHRGDIEVETSAAGTEFRVVLPLTHTTGGGAARE